MTKDKNTQAGLDRDPNRPFGEYGFEYRKNGYSPIPVDGKRPRVADWPSYGPSNSRPTKDRLEDWSQRYADSNIGLVLGGKIGDDYRLSVIDIDDDRFVPVLQALLGKNLIIKLGKKGASAFVRAQEGVKTSKLNSPQFGHVGDILCQKSQVVVPPSKHPETGKPYVWAHRSLLETERDELPKFTVRQLMLLRAVVQSEHTSALLDGSATHDAALRLVANCVRHGEDEEIIRVIKVLLPKSYSGNTVEELPGMIADARRKNFDQPNSSSGYDPGELGPQPLGYTAQSTYVFKMPRSRLVMPMSAQQLTTPAGLLNLAAQEFWAERFPKFGKDGEPTGGFVPQWAGDCLMEACRRKGPFNMERVRGRGVWRERNRVVINLTGDPPIDTENIYVCFDPVNLEDVHEQIDSAEILAAISLPNWKNDADPLLLLGWMLLAPICGVLQWRPHGFLIGARNTGKTTLLNGITRLLSPLVVSLDGHSTEAGIRQRMGADSLPVILDEFESDGNRGRLRGVIKLARSASSAETKIARGTPEGKALQFSLRATFMFAAITPTIGTSADASRIIRFELDRHDNNPEIGRRFNREMQRFESLGQAWCKFAIGFADQVLEAIDIFELEMPPMDSRHAKNMATLLAGAYLALEGKVPLPKEAKVWVEQHWETIQKHGEAHQIDDSEDCLNHLLGTILDEQTIGSILATARKTGGGHNGTPLAFAVCNRGVRMVDGGFVVANRHPGLSEIYRGTRWEDGGWRDLLVRIDGAEPHGPIRFNGPRSRGVFIPEEVLDGIAPVHHDGPFIAY